MRYILAGLLLVVAWLLCVIFAKTIDFLNKNQEWYKSIHVDGEEDEKREV